MADGRVVPTLGRIAHASVLVLTAVLTSTVLVLTANTQIFDSNFIAMTGAQSLLSGDLPFRDFFEPGMPLPAFMAAGTQLLTGYRMIGEFLRQWAFIVAGVTIAFHLGLKLSGSARTTLLALPLTLFVLADTPTYHYSKLFFFPLMIWAGWRYLERPTPQRGAVMGLITAIGFLERHDYGLHLGFASILTFVIARMAVPSARGLRSMVTDASVYGIVVLAVTATWLVPVQRYEGLLGYARTRAGLNEPAPPVYRSLFQITPLTGLVPPPRPKKPAVVGFVWQPQVSPSERQRLEQEHHLSVLPGEDDAGRRRYQVPDVYDPSLLRLDPYINDGAGFEWDRMLELRLRLPSRERVADWLQWMALFVPIALVVSAAAGLLSAWRGDTAIPDHVWKRILAGVFLAVLDEVLFRQSTYVVIVMPLSATLASTFLVSRFGAARALTGLLLFVSTVLAVAGIWRSPLLRPRNYSEELADVFKRLTESPPIYNSLELVYLRQCTRPTDHILVTGTTPVHASFFANRPIAGGHLNWRRGYFSDPLHEQQSLTLLRRQSVPIAVSLADPVMTDFAAYPDIKAYLLEHYREVPGTAGRILVDSRRQPTGRFDRADYPCFADPSQTAVPPGERVNR